MHPLSNAKFVPRRKLFTYGKEIYKGVFDPTGAYIIFRAYEPTAHIIATESGRIIATLSGHRGVVRDVSFSPDGRRAVTASDDCTTRIWEVPSGRCLAELPAAGRWPFKLEGHSRAVVSARYSQDGSRIVTVGEENALRLWNATNGQHIAKLRELPRGIMSGHVLGAMFAGDASRVLYYHRSGLSIFDVASNRDLVVPLIFRIQSVNFSRDFRRIVVSCGALTALDPYENKENQGYAHIVDVTHKGVNERSLGPHHANVSSGDFSRDGTKVLTVAGGVARVWDITTGAELAKLVGHSESVRNDGHSGSVGWATYSPDGNSIVAAEGNVIREWALSW